MERSDCKPAGGPCGMFCVHPITAPNSVNSELDPRSLSSLVKIWMIAFATISGLFAFFADIMKRKINWFEDFQFYFNPLKTIL